MTSTFSLRSHLGNFDVTPDHECMMVYVRNHRSRTVPQIQPVDIPRWCFKPETIWFYFEAPEPEDKTLAGEKIKSTILEEMSP